MVAKANPSLGSAVGPQGHNRPLLLQRAALAVFFVVAAVPLISLLLSCVVVRSQPPIPHRTIPLAISEFVFVKAPFKECHASTLVELPDGSLMAAWFGGTREGAKDVAIWGSRRSDGAWSPPEELASEAGVPCWNPVLFRDRTQRIWLFYKYGSSPKTWKAACRLSTDGRSWSPPRYLPNGILGPAKNKPITSSSGEIVAGTSTETAYKWTSWVETSSDQGATWNRRGPIRLPGFYLGNIQPTLWETKPGEFRMLMRSSSDIGYICESDSRDYGRTWSTPERTDLPNPNSGIDAAKMDDGTIALVYNHTFAHRTPLNIAFSRDDGRTWKTGLVLEDRPGEYSYPAVIQTSDRVLHITYTWRRKRIKHVAVDPKVVDAALAAP